MISFEDGINAGRRDGLSLQVIPGESRRAASYKDG